MERKLLTIVIPTYNRCEVLRENLAHTLPLIEKYQDNVNLYVSDNASPDNTEAVVNSFKKKYSHIMTYYRQNENIGAHENFKHAVHNVNSEYVCLLADEELILPNFFDVLLSIINSNPDVGLIHYNFFKGFLNLEGTEVYYAGLEEPENLFIKKFKNGKEFLYEKLNGPSLVSSNVFRRDLWENSVSKEIDCSGYLWFSILCQSILETPCVYYSLPLVYQRFSGIGGYNDKWLLYYVYGLGRLFKELSVEIDGIYEHWIDFSQVKGHSSLLRSINMANKNRSFYMKHYSEIICFLDRRSDRVQFFMSVHLPRYVFRPIIFIQNFFSRINWRLKYYFKF